MKINNIFEGDIFDSEGRIDKGATEIEVSDEDGKLLVELGQAEEVAKHKPDTKNKK